MHSLLLLQLYDKKILKLHAEQMYIKENMEL